MNPIYKSGSVTRWHAQPLIPAQTIADHQCRVAQIILHFWPNAPREVITTALTHDAHELLTGDIPHPAKTRIGRMIIAGAENQAEKEMGIPREDLHDTEWRMVQFADRLEAYTYVKMFAPQILTEHEWRAALDHIHSLSEHLGVEDALIDWLAS